MNLRLLLVANLIAVIACDQIVVNHSNGEEEPNGKRSQLKGKKTRRNKKKEKWVVDSIFYDDYQSDGPRPTETYDFCPPVPDVIDEDACATDTCKSDIDCSESYRCCFNGCSYSCLYEVQPAAVIDWLKEPRRSRSGISWLMPDKKPSKEEEKATRKEKSTNMKGETSASSTKANPNTTPTLSRKELIIRELDAMDRRVMESLSKFEGKMKRAALHNDEAIHRYLVMEGIIKPTDVNVNNADGSNALCLRADEATVMQNLPAKSPDRNCKTDIGLESNNCFNVNVNDLDGEDNYAAEHGFQIASEIAPLENQSCGIYPGRDDKKCPLNEGSLTEEKVDDKMTDVSCDDAHDQISSSTVYLLMTMDDTYAGMILGYLAGVGHDVGVELETFTEAERERKSMFSERMLLDEIPEKESFNNGGTEDTIRYYSFDEMLDNAVEKVVSCTHAQSRSSRKSIGRKCTSMSLLSTLHPPPPALERLQQRRGFKDNVPLYESGPSHHDYTEALGEGSTNDTHALILDATEKVNLLLHSEYNIEEAEGTFKDVIVVPPSFSDESIESVSTLSSTSDTSLQTSPTASVESIWSTLASISDTLLDVLPPSSVESIVSSLIDMSRHADEEPYAFGDKTLNRQDSLSCLSLRFIDDSESSEDDNKVSRRMNCDNASVEEDVPENSSKEDNMEMANSASEPLKNDVLEGRFRDNSKVEKKSAVAFHPKSGPRIESKVFPTINDVMQEYEKIKKQNRISVRGLDMLVAPGKLPEMMPKHDIGVSLQDLIDKGSKFDESHAKFFCIHLFEILHYLHCRKVVHTAITPRKVIFDATGYPCLTGYDEALVPGHRSHKRPLPVRSQIEYTSPERLLNERITGAADIFSVGILSYMIVYGRTPHKGKTHRETQDNILNENFVPKFEPDALLTKVGKLFLVKCIRKDVSKRFSLRGLGKNLVESVEWFNEYDATMIHNHTSPSPFDQFLKT